MVRFRLLGSIDLRDENDNERRGVLAQPKRLALLAYLCITSRLGPSRRDTVLGVFWPELDQDRARKALNKAVHFLRQELGEEVLVSRSAEELAVDAERLWCDVSAFDAAVSVNDHAKATELYRGDLLKGVFLEEGHEFGAWLDGERARLRSAASRTAHLLARQHELEGDPTSAVLAARRAVELSDSDERVFRELLELLDRLGDRASAVRAYETFASQLAREYETEPAAETQALIARVRERVETRSTGPTAAAVSGQLVRQADSDAPLIAPILWAWSRGPRLRAIGAGALTVIIVVALGAWPLLNNEAPGIARMVSVAVAPMRSLGPDSLAHYAEGLTLEFTTALTRVEGIAPRPSATVAQQYAADSEPISLGRRLKVDYVVTPTVRWHGNRFRITVELVRVADGALTWSPNFEGGLPDLFAVQDSIARQLAGELAGRASVRAIPSGASRGRRDPLAYDLYLRGRRLLHALGTLESAEQAQPLLARAVARDSGFADAWVALAEAYDRLAQLSGRPPREITRRFREAIERAVALDTLNGDAFMRRAQFRLHYQWDIEGADRDMHRALQLNPGSALIHMINGQHLIHVGLRDSALAENTRALQLDPTNPFNVTMQADKLYRLNRLPEATGEAQRALAMDSTQWIAYLVLARVAERQRNYGEAAQHMDDSHRLAGDAPFALGFLAYFYGRAGRGMDANKVLEKLRKLEQRAYVQPIWFALGHLGLSDQTAALDALEQSERVHDRDFFWMLGYGNFEALRGVPRYEAMLHRAKLDRYVRSSHRS